jgi:hypothetical protein
VEAHYLLLRDIGVVSVTVPRLMRPHCFHLIYADAELLMAPRQVTEQYATTKPLPDLMNVQRMARSWMCSSSITSAALPSSISDYSFALPCSFVVI